MPGMWIICQGNLQAVSAHSSTEVGWAAASKAIVVGWPKSFEIHILPPSASHARCGATGLNVCLVEFRDHFALTFFCSLFLPLWN